MQDKTILAVVGMCCLVAMELFALHKGINGTVYSTVVAAIAGLAGYGIGNVIKNKK